MLRKPKQCRTSRKTSLGVRGKEAETHGKNHKIQKAREDGSELLSLRNP